MPDEKKPEKGEKPAPAAATEGVKKAADTAPPPAPPAQGALGDIQMLKDIPLEVRIELGRSRMYLADVLKLRVGSLVELDKLAGDPVDIVVNDKPVARGEILVLNDNFCVRITDVFNPDEQRGRR